MQVMDAGILEDKFTKKNINFRDTIIIFTTNAGRSIYDRPNATGVHSANSSFHRKTILDALESETDPRTGMPSFPPALCSRIGTGYPIMFNYLGVNELEQLASREFERQGGLLEKQYKKKVEFDSTVPICLVLREGAGADARTVKSQVEIFVKTEMLKFTQLYKPDRLNDLLRKVDNIVFANADLDILGDDVKALLAPAEKPKVLLVADQGIGELWTNHMPQVSWRCASDLPSVLQILNSEDIDLVLVDLWIGRENLPTMEISGTTPTFLQFDYVPAAARGIAEGQEILRTLHEKHPELPRYLLSFEGKGMRVDEELFLTCVRSGGARGMVETSFLSTDVDGWKDALADLASTLDLNSRRAWRERKTQQLFSEHKILSFDTAPQVSPDSKTVRIRLRNHRLKRAVAAKDVSEVLDDVERPNISFSDVYGAEAAKAELQYIVNWLREPRKYRDMGLRPPRGILLYGPPGTGKTMLARALAGESNVAFLVATASSFITVWAGSGPQNVRNLFERARRYAPAIIFIDEIDAIGKTRTGGPGGAAETAGQTLNALLTEMDGFATPATKPCIVIAATNMVELLDEALRRRFDRDIEVDKPDRAARTAYLKKRLQGRARRQVSDEVIDRLGGQSAGMTIADLERIVELAGRMAAGLDGVIKDELAEEAFERMRMGEKKGLADSETLERVARHEAGHCMIAWLNGQKPVQITIMARGKAGGFFERESEEDRMIYTKRELESLIRQAMGGRAAEILYYGDEDGLTTGVGEDLRSATRYAEMMVRQYGMDDAVGQIVLESKRFDDGPIAAEVMQAVRKIVKEQLDRGLSELGAQRNTLDQLVKELMEKNRLTRSELEAILPTIS